LVQTLLETARDASGYYPVGKGNVAVTAGPAWDRNVRSVAYPPPLAGYSGCHYIVSFVGELSLAKIGPMAVEPAGIGEVAVVSQGSDNRVGPGWWWEGGALDESADLAATLVAFRDLVEVPVRLQSQYTFDLEKARTGAPVIASIRYLGLDSTEANIATPDHDVDDRASRAFETEIPAVGEVPGFQSLGSLMTLRYRGRERIDPTSYYPHRNAMRTNIDFMGYPTDPLPQLVSGVFSSDHSRVGVDSILNGEAMESDLTISPTPSQVEKTVVTDSLSGEFKEKLSIANGVVNTATTRSDYFIVWFMVHGYQQSDVENLGLTDTLSPSVARRFMMVMDRSNVVKVGDKPRILLMKEVPYSGK
jgi:hypothetical protein